MKLQSSLLISLSSITGQFIDQLLTEPEQLIDSDRIQDHDIMKHASALISVVETGMKNVSRCWYYW